MITQLYTVYDSKSASAWGPMVFVTQGAAKRAFINSVNNPESKTQLATNPEDFSLVHLGTWDDTKMEISTMLPKHVMSGLEARAMKVPDHFERVPDHSETANDDSDTKNDE